MGLFRILVGTQGLEPRTFCLRGSYANQLRHVPNT